MAIDDMTDILLDTGILLQGLTPQECFGRIRSVFQAVVNSKEVKALPKDCYGHSWEIAVNNADQRALFFYELFEQEYERQTSNESFSSFLINSLYWDLPNFATSLYWTVNWAPFIETKRKIWKRVMQEWNPSLAASEWNMNAFLFLIAVFNPRAKDDSILKDESLYERRTRGSSITPYEQGQLLELIHHRTEKTPVFLEHWLSMPRVPVEIRKKLAHAWVNERGWLELRTLFAHSAAIKTLKDVFDSFEFSSST